VDGPDGGFGILLRRGVGMPLLWALADVPGWGEGVKSVPTGPWWFRQVESAARSEIRGGELVVHNTRRKRSQLPWNPAGA